MCQHIRQLLLSVDQPYVAFSIALPKLVTFTLVLKSNLFGYFSGVEGSVQTGQESGDESGSGALKMDPKPQSVVRGDGSSVAVVGVCGVVGAVVLALVVGLAVRQARIRNSSSTEMNVYATNYESDDALSATSDSLSASFDAGNMSTISVT